MALYDNRPFRYPAGALASRVIEDRANSTSRTVYYEPPIRFEKETWVTYADDGRVGIYDDDGNLIDTVEATRVESGMIK